MTPEGLEKLAAAVQEHQRAELRRCVERAVALGFVSIGLWTWEDPPELSDLVGVKPGKIGMWWLSCDPPEPVRFVSTVDDGAAEGPTGKRGR